MVVSMRRALLLGAITCGILLVTGQADAAPSVTWTDLPNQLLQQYTTIATGWVAQFQQLALRTFWLLAFLHVAWSGFKLAFRGGVMEEFVAESVNIIFFVGIGVFALQNGPAIINDIIGSFRVAGQQVGSAALDPSHILYTGFIAAGHVWHSISLWHPAVAVGVMLIALVMLACIAWIAAWVLVALIQVAFYLPVAVFFFAFFGSRWTHELAVSVLRQAFALGAKLMLLELMAGAVVQQLDGMAASLKDFTSAAAGMYIAGAIISAILIKALPDWLAGIIGGAAIGEGHAIAGMGMAAVAGAASAGIGAAAGGAIGANSAKLASAQLAAKDAALGDKAPQRSTLGRAGMIGAYAARNIGSAMATDVGRRLSGHYGARHGHLPWRVSADLAQRARMARDDAQKPRPPSSDNSISGGD